MVEMQLDALKRLKVNLSRKRRWKSQLYSTVLLNTTTFLLYTTNSCKLYTQNFCWILFQLSSDSNPVCGTQISRLPYEWHFLLYIFFFTKDECDFLLFLTILTIVTDTTPLLREKRAFNALIYFSANASLPFCNIKSHAMRFALLGSCNNFIFFQKTKFKIDLEYKTAQCFPFLVGPNFFGYLQTLKFLIIHPNSNSFYVVENQRWKFRPTDTRIFHTSFNS